MCIRDRFRSPRASARCDSEGRSAQIPCVWRTRTMTRRQCTELRCGETTKTSLEFKDAVGIGVNVAKNLQPWG
eukprot:12597729-Alexandrium_andersonii.AAC.1